MQPARREILTWDDVDRLIDHLLSQFKHEYEAMVMITRGGLVSGGLLAEAMGLTHILTAAVKFPAQIEDEQAKLMAWPQFLQFPADELLRGRRALIMDDVWGSGRTITAVKNRVSTAGGFPDTRVLHFNPYRSLFGSLRPDYFAEITEVYVVYPWEIERGPDRVLSNGIG